MGCRADGACLEGGGDSWYKCFNIYFYAEK